MTTYLSDDAPLPSVTLVLGGARSGKSTYAEAMIGTRPAWYLATARIGDDEMMARVRQHRSRRGDNWETFEEPLELVRALREIARPDRPVLVDCLTLWLTNVMLDGRDATEAIAALVAAVPELPGPVIFVSNETGLGIVPDNALARAFRDHAGRLNQAIAAAAGRVVFTVAGLPMMLKDAPDGIPGTKRREP